MELVCPEVNSTWVKADVAELSQSFDLHWVTAIGIVVGGLSTAACAERVTGNAVTGCMMKNNISKVPNICTAW